jgi:hypothetical protein
LGGDNTVRKRKRMIAGNFPYQVAIRVPAGGLLALAADMYKFCHAQALPYRMFRPSETKSGVWEHAIWCFANPMHAQAFRRRFGGDCITVAE